MPQAYLREPLPRCAIFVDRHLHKTGGTTMRGVLFENDVRDGWSYWGYGLNRMPLVAAAARAAMLNASWCADNERAPLLIAGELHADNGLGALDGSLLAHFGPTSPLRQAAAQWACKVVLVTRLREPSRFYESFWRWAGLDLKQKHDRRKWGASMAAWAGRWRNLQANLLLGEYTLCSSNPACSRA